MTLVIEVPRGALLLNVKLKEQLSKVEGQHVREGDAKAEVAEKIGGDPGGCVCIEFILPFWHRCREWPSQCVGSSLHIV